MLHNDVLSLLEELGLAWEGDEATDGCGIQIELIRVELLWYIDGRHHVFENQGCTIQKPFADFKGYNIPEVSKHQKHTCENMSADILHSHSTSLFVCLKSQYWKRPLSLVLKSLLAVWHSTVNIYVLKTKKN